MGKLVDGKWVTGQVGETKGGSFQRESAAFRDHVTKDGRFTPEPGRYRLYVSYACPWAHRTLVVRALKGLEAAIPIVVVDPHMGESGWTFSPPEPLFGATKLYEIYQRANPTFTGRVTVPVLWDTREQTIVSNESAEIIRMLNGPFDAISTRPLEDLYPDSLKDEIDSLNLRVYDTVNNGVYKAGFASSQEAYEQAANALFDTLDALEQHLATRSFLVGDRLTEADVRLFTTLARFDHVYHGHFKCNRRKLIEYPHLAGLARRVYEMPNVAETTRFDHITRHYYTSHPHVNPTGIVPIGPAVDFRHILRRRGSDPRIRARRSFAARRGRGRFFSSVKPDRPATRRRSAPGTRSPSGSRRGRSRCRSRSRPRRPRGPSGRPACTTTAPAAGNRSSCARRPRASRGSS